MLKNLPSIAPQHPLHASRSMAKQAVAVPFIRPPPSEDTNWKVAFEPPSEVVLSGSWATKTAVKAKDDLRYQVDVAVAMPPVSSSVPSTRPLSLNIMHHFRPFSRKKTISMGGHFRNVPITSPSSLRLSPRPNRPSYATFSTTRLPETLAVPSSFFGHVRCYNTRPFHFRLISR